MGRQTAKPRRAKKGHYRLLPGAPDMTEVTVTVPRERVRILRNYAKRLSKSRPAQREEVLWHLRRHAQDLRDRFGVASLALFGSTVRGENRRESDVDLLVEFVEGRPAGMFEFVDLKGWLESILQRPVDLVTPTNLKPRIRDRVLKDAVRII